MRFLMIAASSASALDRSGMFVCTPKSDTNKPIIYAFDGKYLIRDNNAEIPFTKISSLSDQLDLYFAFEPTSWGSKKLALHNSLKMDGEQVETELASFVNFCNSYHYKQSNFKTYYELETETPRIETEAVKTLAAAFAEEKCSGIEDRIDRLLKPVTEQDYNHVKLTINFDEMWVIEERISSGGWSYANEERDDFIHRNEKAIKYQCKSLGIDVPEVDTSKSIVPLASNI